MSSNHAMEAVRAEIEAEFEYRLRTVASYYRARGKDSHEPDPDHIRRHIDGGTDLTMAVMERFRPVAAPASVSSTEPSAKRHTVLTTIEELDALAEGSLLRCGCNYYGIKTAARSYVVGTKPIGAEEMADHLPVTVLYDTAAS